MRSISFRIGSIWVFLDSMILTAGISIPSLFYRYDFNVIMPPSSRTSKINRAIGAQLGNWS